MFFLFGLITFLWLLPWRQVLRQLRPAEEAWGTDCVPVSRVTRHSALWAMAVGHMCNNNGFYFLLASLPLFLVQQRGFLIEQTSYLATLSYIAQAVAALFGGWISDRWSAGGRSEPSVRRGMLVVGQLPVGVAIIGLLVSDVNALSWLCLWLIVAGIGNGLGSLNLYAVAQMFAGSRASGTWVGVQNAVGNISGIVGPVVTGLIIDLRGSYVGGFWLAAGVSMAGAAWWDSCCRASRRPIWNSTGQ